VIKRPGFGKTTTALFIARDMAVRRGEPVLFVTGEQSHLEHMRKLCAMLTGIDSERIKQPHLLSPDELESVHRALGQIEKAPLYFVAMGDPMYVKATARRISARCQELFGKKLALVVVDYLQIMPPMPNRKADTRDREVGDMSRYLKLMAMDMGLLVMMLAQLNREVEKRSDHRPMLADLRESGNIEQDSDIVVFTFRPTEYMDEAARRRALADYQDGYEPYQHIVAKWRDGKTGTARNAWNRATGDIISITEARS